MAKASKKASAKKAAAKSAGKQASIKNNKLTIDLSSASLTDKELQKFLNTIQRSAAATTKKAPAKNRSAAAKAAPLKAGASAAATGATVTATFFNTLPGLSDLTATHKGISHTITQSDTIDFDNVSVNDLIRIKGSSLGRAEISVDRTANPQQRTFPPGAIRFHFTIKP